MSGFFRLLPADCTPELDSKQRDTLLKKGEYILPGGDSMETIKYNIDSFGYSNYFRYVFNFTTGQNGFVAFELRKFKRNDSSIFIVYSRVGGALRAYDQHDLFIFDYKNGKLFLSKEKLLPVNIPVKNFLKKETPDSIVKSINNSVMATYSLHSENPNSISFNLNLGVPLDEYEKNILGYTMLFTWNGKSFTRKLVKDKEE